MQVIRKRPGEACTMRGARSIVTIGNFDGLHLGHRALIRRSQQLAGDIDQVAVVTFEPLPQALFQPDAAPARLSTVYQKLSVLQAWKADLVWMMRFDASLAQLTARDFAWRVISQGLSARQVVVGADFHFGHRREGDVDSLRTLGTEFDFEVDIVPAVYLDDKRVSSTTIRRALAGGELHRAAAMLGRPFRMEGHVVPGQQLGRKLGFPTANLRIRARPCPLQGIFAVFAGLADGQGGTRWLPAVSSIGWRPTVGGQEPLLEVYLFDFDGDLYGQRLVVEFVAKLRDEAHFEAIEELVAQMRRDETEARNILAKIEWRGEV